MKKLGKFKTLTIASLSVVALAAPVAISQTAGTTQDAQQKMSRGEGRGHGERWGNKQGKDWRGGRGGRMHGMMFRDLNLTDDQKAKMKTIGASFRENTKALREQLRAKRQELRQAN